MSSGNAVLVVLAVASAIAWVKKLLPVACVIAWGLACFKIKEFKKVKKLI